MTIAPQQHVEFEYAKYGFRDEEHYTYKSEKGLNEQVVRTLSRMKNEPAWMLARRLKALAIYFKKPVPTTGMWANPKLAELDDQNIYYYVRPGEKSQTSWDDVPQTIRTTFEKLGIPEAEQKFLAGVGAQYESESVYHSLRAEWEKLGVIFLDMDAALREYPEIVKEYFGTVIPAAVPIPTTASAAAMPAPTSLAFIRGSPMSCHICAGKGWLRIPAFVRACSPWNTIPADSMPIAAKTMARRG